MTRPDADAGFTLVELLVVMVIMPLVIGAIAAAIIISEQDSGVASSRLSDSTSAQIASEYYARDVQGAQYVTTNSSASSPTVCVNPKLAGPTLVLGLYRPAGSGGSTSGALSIGYWATGGASPELVRDSCTVSSGTSTFNDEVPISSDTDPASASATIVPSQFATGATGGWAPTTATTSVVTTTSLPAGTLQVGSTSVFVNGTIGVRSSAGYQTLTTCTVTSSTSFSCPGGSGQVTAGSSVRQQDSISNISLSATESGSGYTYSLQATPRAWVSRLSGNFAPDAPFAAALVALDPAGVNLAGGSIQVNGIATFAGPLTATGGASLSAQAAINTDGPITCTGGTVTAGPSSTSQCGNTGGTPTADPLGPIIGTATPQGLTSQTCPPNYNQPLSPGIYTCELIVPPLKTVFLRPGVYELQGGISVPGSSSINMVVGSTGGALLYLTCPTASSCTEPDNFQAGATVAIPPLTASQSNTYFPTLQTPALQDVWLWQDSSDGAAATLVGNGASGTAYLPSAVVDLSNNSGRSTGRIVAAGITMSGGSLTLTGQ